MKDNLFPVDIRVEKNVPVVSSRDVAMTFDKRHDHVLRDIDNLIRYKPNFGEISTWFIRREETDSRGRSQPMFLMTRDGFSLLAMGFTGKKALQFKIAYINAFNRMEKCIKDAETLFEYNEKKQLLSENRKMKHKADFYDAVTNSKDTCDIETVAKTLCIENFGRNNLYKFLRDNHILQENNMPYQKYINAGYFTIDQEIIPDTPICSIRRKLMVFQKGVDFILKLFNKHKLKKFTYVQTELIPS